MSFEYSTPAIDRWKLDDFMQIIDVFEDDFADTVHHKVRISKDYQTILLHIIGKSLVTAREILTLCAYGYPDGALSLGRNLYEQMIIVFFFEIHKNDADFQGYIDDFFLSYEVQRNRCLRDLERYVPDGNMEDLQVEWAKLKTCAKHELRGDYWWTGCSSFSDLVKYVMEKQKDDSLYRFLGIQYMRYKRACVSLHAGCLGNSKRIGSETGSNVVDTAPTLYGQTLPLIYATVSLISIIGSACDAFEIDSSKYLKALTKLTFYYQEQEKVDYKETDKHEC